MREEYSVKEIQYSAKEIQQTETNDDDIEDLWLEIQVHKYKSFIVGAIYRPPSSKALSFNHIDQTLTYMSSLKKDIYALGDLNDNQFKPNKISTILHRLRLHQLITEPTRISKTSSTLIDLIITNNKESVLNVSVLPSIADHHEIGCTIDIRKKRKIKSHLITCRPKNTYSPEAFQTQLKKDHNIHRLNSIFQTDNVDSQVQIFTETFTSSLDAIAPSRTIIMKRPPVKWMTDEIRTEITRKNQLQRQSKFDHALLQSYKAQVIKVRNIVKKAKAESYHAEIRKAHTNPKETWKILKRIVPYEAKKKQTDFDNAKETAHNFNTYFANIGEATYREVTKQPNSPIQPPQQNEIRTNSSQETEKWQPQPATTSSIKAVIYSLKNTKSTGADNITLQHIKDSLPATMPFLLTIINTSIATNKFPSQWKHAEVCTIHKKGNTTDPSNFRPISLLSTLSKILEKEIANQLQTYLESHNLLNKYQYAYRRHTSTEDALLNITETAYKAIDNGEITLLVLLDMSKAFDSVNHNILLHKLNSLNINSRWFESYLSNRTQSVKIKREISQPMRINYGVPQGSILGPQLFLIFVNDIRQNLPPNNAKLIMYADDLQVAITGKPSEIYTIKTRIETILENIKQWYDLNGLQVNAGKTHCLAIGSVQNLNKIPHKFSIIFDNKPIEIETTAKTLGILLDKSLTFNDHINNLCSKLNGTLLYLNKIKHNLDYKSRHLIVNALIFSHINYCPMIWGKCSANDREKIQRCINFAAKVVSNGNYRKYDHVTPLINELEWLRINNRLALQEATCVYKNQHNNSNAHCLQFKTLRQQFANSDRSTRNDSNIHYEFRNTDSGRKAVSIHGPQIWNKIPTDIQNCASISKFKKEYSAHLLIKQLSN